MLRGRHDPLEIRDLLIVGKGLEEWDVSDIIWPVMPEHAYPND
ncbi:hypothetical protein ABKW33_06510 [Sanguibacter sp. 26GB23]